MVKMKKRIPSVQHEKILTVHKKSITKKSEKILITAALPYANASIHIGHLIEYTQADIVARFLRLIGKDVIYICASDTHGTPIEVNAAKLGVKPEDLVARFAAEHRDDFKSFHILFDEYYTTHSPENKKLSEFFFQTLMKKKYIVKKFVDVMHCPHCNRVLPDRFVRGTCPNCGAADQYGDVCESCGITHKSTELLNPQCSICGKTPAIKNSEHYFFTLSRFSDKLRTWLETNKNLQPEIQNFIREWLIKGLDDWCISRDGPYFGFLIPGEKDKYFYVWLDAPIGYISTTQHFTPAWGDYWKKKGSTIIHFIGKDILYFHFLFWPALLMAVGFHVPDDIVVHGFLTVNGKKMSKSRGTFFTAREFLKLYNPEYLRFYYALHLNKKVIDIDLDFEDFQATVNNKLVANLANFCYRVLSFVEKNYGGSIDDVESGQIIADVKKKIDNIKKHYESYAIKDALSEILAISDIGNAHFQTAQPWKNKDTACAAVGLDVHLVRVLSILVSPILPVFSARIQDQLCEHNLVWDDIKFDGPLVVKKSSIIFTKVEHIPKQFVFPLDLRVARIVSVEDHPNADSLYVLRVDLGSEQRQLVAGLKKHYEKGSLLGKLVVMCANLVPATIRGVESKGMVLAADDGQHLCALEAPNSMPGMAVTLEGYSSLTAPVTFEQFKKVGLKIENTHVVHEGKHLKTEKEDIVVTHVREGVLVR